MTPSPNNIRAAALALLTAFWLACPTSAQEARPAAAEPVMWSDVEIEFEGAHIFKSENLKRVVRQSVERSLAEADGRPQDRDLSRKPYDPALLEYILRQVVVNHMRRSGYLSARTGEPRQQILGRTLAVTVPVAEGELYRLGEIKIEGAHHFSAEKLLELLPLKRGDVADGVAVVRWLSEHLDGLYGESGFIQYDYEVEPEFVVETGAPEGVANFNITINEGPQFRLRQISFSGNTRAPEETLRAAFHLGDGEVFSRQKFREGIQRLNNPNFFDHLEHLDADKDVVFKTDEESDEVEIVIRLKEKGETDKGVPPRGGQ